MKRIISCIGWILLLAFLLNATPVFAAETTPEDVLLEVTSGKEAYEDGEAVSISLTVENNLPFAITNVYVQLTPPDGFSIENEEKLPVGEMIRSGKKLSAKVTLAQQAPPEDATGLPAQQSPQEEEEAQDYSLWIIIGAIIVGLAIVTVVVILIIKKKRGTKTVISMLLVCALLGSMIVLPAQAATANIGRESRTEAVTFSVDGETHTLTATVYFDQNEHADDLQIDTSRLGYQEDLEAFVITDEFDGLYGTLKNEKKYSEIKLEVYTEQGTLLQKQSIPATAAWHFEEVGLIPGVNRVKITAIGEAILVVQLNLYDPFGANYQYLDGHDTDSDEEGLFDLLEKELGTDPLNPDTDGDGLTDYEEVYKLSTDPLKADSDDNGIPDGDEDYDGDQISDKEELALGLSPILDDTDGDKVSDYDELNLYGTDPFTKDSDGDGAEDGWEVEYGYQPNSANGTFTVSEKTNPVSTANPISLEVDVTGSGTAMDVESLKISPVSVADNPFASPCIAGYMGTMMDITIDGSFETATLTFRYDTSLGTLGPDFQPRIYYFNESKKIFEELENQTVRNGVVTAKTNHFSGYAVINSSAHDASCSADEVTELYNSTYGTSLTQDEIFASYAKADIALVLDNSASMAWNDPSGKRWEVAHYFIDHLRSGFDRGAVFTYTKALEPIQRLTKDQELLKAAVDSIRTDNGVSSASGTNGFAALNTALEGLTGSSGSYRYVIFFSDGDDSYLKENLEQIKTAAVDCDARIICIGIGTGGHSYLADLAEATGGQYYSIDASTSVPSTFSKALEVFDAITPTTNDRNKDGLDDFVTQLIFEGKLPVLNQSTEFKGLDFNYNEQNKLSPDWDGDGIPNGDEITVVIQDGKLYLNMTSYPTVPDSDNDGFTDKEERDKGLDPFLYNIDAYNANKFLDDLEFVHSASLSERYHTNFWDRLGVNACAALSFKFSREEIYRDTLMQYIKEYGGQYQVDYEAMKTEQKMLKATLYDVLSFVQGISGPLSYPIKGTDNLAEEVGNIHNLYNIIYSLNAATTMRELQEVKNAANKVFLYLSNKETFAGFTLNLKTMPVLIEKTKIPDAISDGLSIAVALCDVVDSIHSCAEVSANNAFFMANKDILTNIRYKAALDDYAKDAAANLLAMLDEHYGNEILLVFKDLVFDHAAKFVIKKAMTSNIYTAALLLVMTALDKIFGISEKIDQRFRSYAYLEFARASSRLFHNYVSITYKHYELVGFHSGTIRRDYYNIEDKNNIDLLRRYFFHAAHAHILGELEYYKWFGSESNSRNSATARKNKEAFLAQIASYPLVLDVKLPSEIFDS